MFIFNTYPKQCYYDTAMIHGAIKHCKNVNIILNMMVETDTI